MKKALFALIAATLIGTSAQALEINLSAGAGVGASFLTRKTTTTSTILGYSSVFSNEYPKTQLNFQAFADATYLMVRVAYGTKVGNATKIYVESGYSETTTIDYTYSALDLDLYLKYPFAVQRTIAVFPLLGIRYSINLDESGKADLNATEQADLNDFYLLLGAGADISLTKQLYVRPIVSYGFNLTANPSTDMSTSYASSEYYGHSISIDLLVGYRF